LRLVSSKTTTVAFCATSVVWALAPGVLPGHGARARAQAVESTNEETSAWVEREARLMGTRLRLRIEAPSRRTGLRASERALESMRRVESLLSTWRSDSELSRINRSPVGASAPLSPRLGDVLDEVLTWSRKTNGAFEPGSGALVDAWALRADGRVPADEELEDALAATGPGAFTLSADGTAATRHHRSAWIDAGGFGKGLALRAARRALREAGIENGILDFGGQILTLGRDRRSPGQPAEDEDGTGWRIPVARPDDRFRPAGTLAVDAASVSTSGGSERFVVPDGELLSHVVDPRTGRPVPPWGSVTVVADDPLVADVVSTALFVMGPDEGMEWARGRTDMGVLFLSTGGGGARWNATMEPFLTEPLSIDRLGDAHDGTPEVAAEEGL